MKLLPSQVFVLTVSILGVEQAAATPYFFGLGETNTLATAISADGVIVAGRRINQGTDRGFRWTLAGGFEALPDPDPGKDTIVNGISADGSTVVGHTVLSNIIAAQWTATAELSLGCVVPSGCNTSSANDVSADGTVVVGLLSTPGGASELGFRWSHGVGVSLTPLTGFTDSSATGVSDDGMVIIGDSLVPTRQATVWTGGVPMAIPTTDGLESKADAISGDGTTVVGRAGADVFRWTAADGTQPLSVGSFADAWAVSEDGSVIVGSGFDVSGGAWVWDAEHGARRIHDVLASLGVDTAGWTLGSAKAISADGLTIAGWGSNPDGLTESWVAYLPEPSSMVLLLGAIVASSFFCRPGGVSTTASQMGRRSA